MHHVAAYLDLLGLYSISPDKWSGFSYKPKCLDFFFDLGDMADASPHLSLVMSGACGLGGVTQTAACRLGKLLRLTAREEGKFTYLFIYFFLHRREARWLQLGVISRTGCLLCTAERDVGWGQGLLKIPSLTTSGRVGEDGIKSQIVPCETQAAILHQAKFY